MTRFIVLFPVLLVVCMALTAAMMSQYGYSLFAPEMRMMLLVALLVAGYVSFRISQVVARRKRRTGDTGEAEGSGRRAFGAFSTKSSSQRAREARVAARRKQLAEEGKLEEETPPAAARDEDTAPTRVSQSAPIKDRMAARAERVRRAREAGKLGDD